jgi:hypothetical protein
VAPGGSNAGEVAVDDLEVAQAEDAEAAVVWQHLRPGLRDHTFHTLDAFAGVVADQSGGALS